MPEVFFDKSAMLMNLGVVQANDIGMPALIERRMEASGHFQQGTYKHGSPRRAVIAPLSECHHHQTHVAPETFSDHAENLQS